MQTEIQRVKEPYFALARERLYLPPGVSEAINLSIASGNRTLIGDGAPVRTLGQKRNAGGNVGFCTQKQTFCKLSAFAVPLPSRLAAIHNPYSRGDCHWQSFYRTKKTTGCAGGSRL